VIGNENPTVADAGGFGRIGLPNKVENIGSPVWSCRRDERMKIIVRGIRSSNLFTAYQFAAHTCHAITVNSIPRRSCSFLCLPATSLYTLRFSTRPLHP
jgi:hypothetical protein